MSSKISLLLSKAGEHWYYDVNDDSIVLNIDGEHDIRTDAVSTTITIEEGTALHDVLRNMKPCFWDEIKHEKKLATGGALSLESDRPASKIFGEEETNAKKDS